MVKLSKLYEAIIVGDAEAAVRVTEAALEAGIDPQEIINRHMITAMDEVGRRFEAFDYFVPELLIAARAMKASLALVRPLLVESGVESRGKVVIGTVKGDLHDIGKNLVASMLEGSGFEVTDLGVDVPPESFVAAIREQEADIVALSALLTTTMPFMETTIEALKDADVRGKIKVMIGGPPTTQKYADEIGADGYSQNANGAVNVAKQLVVT